MYTNELDGMYGFTDEEVDRRFKEAVRISDEVRKIKGLPSARYDLEKQKVYWEYPDGRVVYDE